MDDQSHHERPLRLALLANRYNELSHQLEEAEPVLKAQLEDERTACLSQMALIMGYAPNDLLARAGILDAISDPATFHRWKEIIATSGADRGELP